MFLFQLRRSLAFLLCLSVLAIFLVLLMGLFHKVRDVTRENTGLISFYIKEDSSLNIDLTYVLEPS
jgi:uncharacterized membrane protein